MELRWIRKINWWNESKSKYPKCRWIKTVGEFGYFNCLSSMIRNNTRYTQEIKSNIDIAKLHSKIRNTFQRQIWLNFLEETRKLLHLLQVIFMVLNIAHFRKWIINNWRELNCGAVGGRWSSFCSFVWEMRKYYI
jgi:hypothetical protein